jgi:hypothetical protein
MAKATSTKSVSSFRGCSAQAIGAPTRTYGVIPLPHESSERSIPGYKRFPLSKADRTALEGIADHPVNRLWELLTVERRRRSSCSPPENLSVHQAKKWTLISA